MALLPVMGVQLGTSAKVDAGVGGSGPGREAHKVPSTLTRVHSAPCPPFGQSFLYPPGLAFFPIFLSSPERDRQNLTWIKIL